jgi:4-amino-4-deoxy-L-arabinose transferase-like glycosyltransferase
MTTVELRQGNRAVARVWSQHGLWVLAIALVALAVRIAVVAATPHYVPISDPQDYDRYGVAIAHTGHFPSSDFPAGGPTAYRPPAYPYFVGGVYAVANWLGLDSSHGHLTGSRWTDVRLLQALIGVLTVLLIGLIVRQIWRRGPDLVAMGLSAVFPPFLALSDSLLSENLLVPLVLAAVAAVLRYRETRGLRWVGVAGVLTGLATLTHANAAVLVLPLAAGVWATPWRASPDGLASEFASRARGIGPAALLVVVAALTVLPWTIRNAVELHAFVPVSTEAGPTLAGTYNATAARQTTLPGNWIPWWEDGVNAAALRRAAGSEVRTDAALQSDGLHYALHHPSYVVTVAARNVQRMLGLGGSRWVSLYATGTSTPRRLIALDGYAILLILPFALVGAFSRTARAAPRFLWFVPLLLLASVVLLVSYERVRTPVDPFLLMLAAIPVARLLELVAARRPALARRQMSPAQ